MSEQERLVDNGNNADPARIKIRSPFPFNLLPQLVLKKYKKIWKQFNAFKYYDVTHYFLLQLYEQIKVIIPITLYFVLFAALIFNQSTENGAVVGFGILAVILGLTLFIEGLKFALMPLGESIGRLMPEKLHIALVLMLSFVIGIAVTYAEPAIAAIAPLTSEVKRKQQPYLFYMVNNWREMLVLSIGLGVGTATVLGIIRFTRRWSLKPLIYSIGGSTIALSLFMHVANDNLRPLVNLAWDIGVVATGPVTVPIILSIGIGVSAQQEFRKHQLERETRLLQRRDSKLNTNGLIIEEEVIEDGPQEESNKKVDAFGVVTLAALLPVLCIEILSVILVYSKSIEQILKETKSVHHNSELPFLEKSPIIEVIYAFRAIVPLGVLLVVILLVFLRGHLPEITLRKIMALDASEQKASKSEEELRVISVEGSPNFNLATSMDVLRANKEELGLYETSEEEIARYRQEAKTGEAVVPQLRFVIDTTAFVSTQDREEMLHKQKMFNERTTSGYDISSKFLRSRSKEQVYIDNAPMVGTDLESEDSHSESYEDKDRMDMLESGESSEAESRSQNNRQWLSTSMKMILLGFVFAQLGMLLFNLGLTYGMTPLAGLLGKILPTGLMAIDGVENSPFFDRSIGLLIVCLFAFFLGVLATFAEPVMNVMGSKVEQITQGQFKSSVLIFAVSIGVGSGVLLGVLIILYQLSLIYFIIVGYGIALLLTHYSQEDIVNIAWDSAGVTTGPVTVPFVLALGLSFGNAVNAASGFGILACASFMPINSVLLSGLLLRYIASRRQLKNAPQTRSLPMA